MVIVLNVVPLLFGKPLNIWLGLVLLVLFSIQLTLGIILARGVGDVLKYHKINAALMAGVLFVHAYFGIGIWFFKFKYGG